MQTRLLLSPVKTQSPVRLKNAADRVPPPAQPSLGAAPPGGARAVLPPAQQRPARAIHVFGSDEMAASWRIVCLAEYLFEFLVQKTQVHYLSGTHTAHYAPRTTGAAHTDPGNPRNAREKDEENLSLLKLEQMEAAKPRRTATITQ
ncbi:hypothetical protein CSAL01_00793 [Colletotrichum salicis]|uniref:Uncharacterized protein n=1 Tax=Colletotrichum salicis TaxID=1209931 RepID=A0A135V492_9PEZI|nr:hypothetical protein CSAL01_00793 [Colletotrichum salicis]